MYRMKTQWMTILSIAAISSFLSACENESGNSETSENKCNCENRENCDAEQLAKCDEDQPKCNCATGENCTAEEQANCGTVTVTCDCKTGNGCTNEEKLACQTNQDLCETLECPAGEECSGGVCVETACIGKNCEEGSVCRGGNCIEISCLGVDCEDNEFCKAGKCLSTNCKTVKCSEGKSCNNAGECVLDEPVSLIMMRSSSATETTECSETGVSYVMQLSAQPESDVTINVAVNDQKIMTAKQSSFVFTHDNWNEPQILEFIGNCEHTVDGDQPAHITIKSTSGDPSFNSINIEFDLTNVDSDHALFDVRRPDDLTVEESCEMSSGACNLLPENYLEIGLKLAAKPKDDLQCIVEQGTVDGYLWLCLTDSIDNSAMCNGVSCECSANQALYITRENSDESFYSSTAWNEEAKFYVFAADDNKTIGNISIPITVKCVSYHGAENSHYDAAFDALDYKLFEVMRIDNDTPTLRPKVTTIDTFDDGREVQVCGRLNAHPNNDEHVMVTASLDTTDVAPQADYFSIILAPICFCQKCYE